VEPVTALTIAGSDSGGGAGVQADLRTFSAFGLHATSALTAVTAQNTRGVSAVANVDVQMVAAQVEAVLTDFAVAGVKTGMLAQPSTVESIATFARDGRLPHLVVDPVLVSTSGHVLMEVGGVAAYREALVPYATVLTPNLAEAAVLCGVELGDVRQLADMADLARQLGELGPTWVLVKGGHLLTGEGRERAPDLLVGPEGVSVLDAPRLDTRNDHGTGCSLSAAIVAGLALGREVPEAVRDAKSFVLAALEGAVGWRLGDGRGPIDHLGWGP
jgi:hydroxymethylpyrimidine/phosphomethylpyrimidine kinase